MRSGCVTGAVLSDFGVGGGQVSRRLYDNSGTPPPVMSGSTVEVATELQTYPAHFPTRRRNAGSFEKMPRGTNSSVRVGRRPTIPARRLKGVRASAGGVDLGLKVDAVDLPRTEVRLGKFFDSAIENDRSAHAAVQKHVQRSRHTSRFLIRRLIELRPAMHAAMC